MGVKRGKASVWKLRQFSTAPDKKKKELFKRYLDIMEEEEAEEEEEIRTNTGTSHQGANKMLS